MPKRVLNDLAKQSKKFIGALPVMPKMKDGSPETVSSPETEAYDRLPTMMELMGAMIENDNRLVMYESEIGMIHQLGMSFQEWRQLAPLSNSPGSGGI